MTQQNTPERTSTHLYTLAMSTLGEPVQVPARAAFTQKDGLPLIQGNTRADLTINGRVYRNVRVNVSLIFQAEDKAALLTPNAQASVRMPEYAPVVAPQVVAVPPVAVVQPESAAAFAQSAVRGYPMPEVQTPQSTGTVRIVRDVPPVTVKAGTVGERTSVGGFVRDGKWLPAFAKPNNANQWTLINNHDAMHDCVLCSIMWGKAQPYAPAQASTPVAPAIPMGPASVTPPVMQAPTPAPAQASAPMNLDARLDMLERNVNMLVNVITKMAGA